MLHKGLPVFYQIGVSSAALKRSDRIDQTESLVGQGSTNHFGFNEPEIRRPEIFEPAKNLMAAVVLRALKDLEITITTDKRNGGKITSDARYDAYHWFFGEPLPLPKYRDLYSFAAICDDLGINLNAARDAIRSLIPAGLEIPRRTSRTWLGANNRRSRRD